MSVKAALLELLATATWAGVVPPDTLERINKRRRRVCVGQSAMPRTGGPPRPILLGRIGECVPARELANRILKRPNQVVVEARHALGISQGSLEIPAKIIVAHHHGVDQTAFEGLADNIRQFLEAKQRNRQHPAAPDKALLLRLQRAIEPEQVGLRLVSRDPSGGREISQSR